jgi:hypothetical protein
MWTGVEFEHQGRTLRMASDEPLCGCLRFTNISGQTVHIRSTMQGRMLGALDLEAGKSTSANFDWAGPSGEDSFHLDTWDVAGHQLHAQDVLRVDDTGWPWFPCVGRLPGHVDPPACPIGPLRLTTGRQQP